MGGPRRTPLGAIARGVGAGLIGTAVLTAYQTAVQRARGGGGPDGGDPSWGDAPAPAQVGRRVLEGVFRQGVGEERIPVLTHGLHWTYGTLWGAVYGLVQESIDARPALHGLLFGTGVWALGYAQLVPMGIYEPPWRYEPKELAVDASYHVVYGLAVAAAYEALDR